ncbi:MAG: SRPBCC family protein, partial [Methylocella sp.]
PAQVFRALTDKAAKARWFSGGEGYEIVEREMDVRPGGRERVKGRWTSGVTTHFEAVYFDVIPNERLVYAYEMHLDDRKISVSLATMELQPEGAGTRLVVTEQGSFLDGYDDAGSRERGTGFLLDRLGASLQG